MCNRLSISLMFEICLRWLSRRCWQKADWSLYQILSLVVLRDSLYHSWSIMCIFCSRVQSVVCKYILSLSLVIYVHGLDQWLCRSSLSSKYLHRPLSHMNSSRRPILFRLSLTPLIIWNYVVLDNRFSSIFSVQYLWIDLLFAIFIFVLILIQTWLLC